MVTDRFGMTRLFFGCGSLVGEFGDGLGEEAPGFFVGFEVVAVGVFGVDGVEGDGELAAAEEEGGGDDVPGVLGDDVGDEEVEVAEGVAAAGGVGLELAEVSVAGAAGGGFDLHADEAGVVVEADVVGEGVSPGLEDVEAAFEGGGHETEFDPLSTLLEGGKMLDLHWLCSPVRPKEFGLKEKARPGGRALFSENFSLYFQNIKWNGGM